MLYKIKILNKMTQLANKQLKMELKDLVEIAFNEWWHLVDTPPTGFNKTAMLDFAEFYHNKEKVKQQELLKDAAEAVKKQSDRSNLDFLSSFSIGNIKDGFYYKGLNSGFLLCHEILKRVLDETNT